MGYDTYWFDNNDDVSNFDFANSIFFTEGQVDGKIPLRKDCQYIVHWCDNAKYSDYNSVRLWVFNNKLKGTKLNNHTYIDGRDIYQPWATDLLPSEIIPNTLPRDNVINYIGTVGRGDSFAACEGFARAARSKNIGFNILGGYSSNFGSPYLAVQGGFVDNDRAIDLVRRSYLAPTFQSELQLGTEYVPCRIFKNISYGQYAITNNPCLAKLFDEEIICNLNTHDLFFEAEAKKGTQNLEKLMQIVKEKHTFINRVQPIEDMFASF
jgi:hypothetical protein